MSTTRARQLAEVSVAATAIFTATAVASATRASARLDRALSPRLAPRPRTRRRRVAEQLSPVGKWYTVAPAALLAAALLARDDHRRGAGLAITSSAVLAVALARIFDGVLPQPPVPPNHRHEPDKPVFPSGHALIGTSVAATAAYVLSREKLVLGPVAAAIALVFSVGNPALKLAVRKHWFTDAIGGLAAGVAVAAGCCSAYERLRPND